MLDLIALREVSSAQRYGSYCNIFHCLSRGRALRARSCEYSILEIEVAIIPLIDAVSNGDSNGGYIIFCSKLDLCCENSAPGPNWTVLSGKFDRF